MNDDTFLEGLRADWQNRKVELGSTRYLVEKREKEIRSEVGRNLLTIGLFLAGAVIFASNAWLKDDALLALGALVFLASIPFLVVELRMLRREIVTDYLQEGRALLEHGLRQAQANLRILRLTRWASALFLFFALIVLGLAVSGMAPVFRASVVGGAWALAAGGSYMWQRRRTAEAIAEHDHYLVMLREFSANGE